MNKFILPPKTLSFACGGALAQARRPPHRYRQFSTSSPRTVDITHAVIGGGVVGLAVARRLQRRGGDTVLIERNERVGMETSSRNSEVIHAGLYYGTDSLKARLCIRGKEMLYELCKTHDIPYCNTGKWIVAQNTAEMSLLENIHKSSKQLGVPTYFLGQKEAAERETAVRAEAGVLESATTGIVDSHTLMQYLQGDFENAGGICAFQSNVTGITPLDSGRGGWEIATRDPNDKNEEEEKTSITASILINSAGLHANPLSNSILPPSRYKTAAYAKGNYFSYTSSSPKTKTLIYPAPVPGHGGLGTHLTLDLSGRIRFGPDVEWTDDPTDLTPSKKNLEAAAKEIRSYLPGVEEGALVPDYVGVRPKIGGASGSGSGKGGGSQDFYIEKEDGFEGFVNLLGIESPGLTSALAIGEYVEELVYGR